LSIFCEFLKEIDQLISGQFTDQDLSEVEQEYEQMIKVCCHIYSNIAILVIFTLAIVILPSGK